MKIVFTEKLNATAIKSYNNNKFIEFEAKNILAPESKSFFINLCSLDIEKQHELFGQLINKNIKITIETI